MIAMPMMTTTGMSMFGAYIGDDTTPTTMATTTMTMTITTI
jgi:hypothetical protein